jgi:hypothetical protein
VGVHGDGRVKTMARCEASCLHLVMHGMHASTRLCGCGAYSSTSTGSHTKSSLWHKRWGVIFVPKRAFCMGDSNEGGVAPKVGDCGLRFVSLIDRNGEPFEWCLTVSTTVKSVTSRAGDLFWIFDLGGAPQLIGKSRPTRPQWGGYNF